MNLDKGLSEKIKGIAKACFSSMRALISIGHFSTIKWIAESHALTVNQFSIV